MSCLKRPNLILTITSLLISLGYTHTSYAAEQTSNFKQVSSLTQTEQLSSTDRIIALENRIQTLIDHIDEQSNKSIRQNKEIESLNAKNKILNDFSYDTNTLSKLSNKISQHDSDLRASTFSLLAIIIATITLFIAVLSFIGFGGFKYLKNKVDEIIDQQVQAVLDNKAFLVQMSIVNKSGFDHYQNFFQTNDFIQLGSAIRQTKWALDLASRLDINSLSSDDKKDWFLLFGQIKNNLSYYIALNEKESSTDELKMAHVLAEDVYNMTNDTNSDLNSITKADWKESYAFVKHTLGDDCQKRDACNVIKGLIADPHLPTEWREDLEREWAEKCSDIWAS